VTVFFSAKLTPAQQNYPVHKQEMLAGLESMLCHQDFLQGAHFWWFTDYKGLEHLLKQKNLSGRQARWMEAMGDFNFNVIYIEEAENILADALSRIYANDAPGTIWSPTEYPQHDDNSLPPLTTGLD
jgi:hypothetical protein